MIDLPPMPLAQLLGRLQEREAANRGFKSIFKYTDDAGVVVNRVDTPLGHLPTGMPMLQAKLLSGGDEREQQEEMAEVLGLTRCPVQYVVVAVQEEGGPVRDVDVLFYREDGGAWARGLVPVPKGVSGVAGRIPWASGKRSPLNFKGLEPGTLASFTNPAGGADVVAAVTDADIDTDGPGGSHAKDRWWSEHTSLRHPNGESCDSRNFPGVVTPPALRAKYGISIGDLAWCCLGDKEFGAQVYDSGPPDKIGEISFGLAVDLGIYPDRTAATETRAAMKGNTVENLVTVFFPGSGQGKALPPEALQIAAQRRVQQWLGELPVAEQALVRVKDTDWANHFASFGLPAFITAVEVMTKTGNAPNTPPPRELWDNIAPTLAVLANIREHFGKPLVFHSTYRSLAYNATLSGAAKRSQHLAFRAVDFHIAGVPHHDVAAYARELRGKPFKVARANLQMTNAVQGMANPPSLNLGKLKLTSPTGGGTAFEFHGGIAEYDTFVHVDCRGDDSDWG